MKRFFPFLLMLFLYFPMHLDAQNGFLKANGKRILDQQGRPIILRGMGLGGWMLQEGYMLETGDFAGPQNKIRATIEALIGAENTETFYATWLDNYCTRADVDSMKAWGFNSIRLQMHYNLYTLPIEKEPAAGVDTWLDKGFEMTDSLLAWCTANEMYLILDLHAAPGGQGKDANISDYDPAKPSLWESAENRRKTVALWKKLAQRYANEPWMGGYDLLNEPNWDVDNAGNANGCSCNQNTAIWNLYKEIITAVRTVDTNHLVIIEGNCWGNNYNGMPAAKTFDSNLVMSFHKYWNYNDQAAIQGLLNLQNTHNIPLWLGESGENSNNWFTNAIELVERNNIGWAWWPYKKIGSVAGTVTIPKSDGYQMLLDYWKGNKPKPSMAEATEILMDLTAQMKIANAIIRSYVIDAMFRQVSDKTPNPFKQHTVPGRIFASDFDMGRSGVAYFDVDSANYHVSTNSYTAWNQGWSYRNDGIDIQVSTDQSVSNGYHVGWTNDGEWMLYSAQVEQEGAYQVEVRYASASAVGKIHIVVDGVDVTGTVQLPATGGWNTWKSYTIGNVPLKKGTHQIKFYIEKSGFNINYLNFTKPVGLKDVAPRIINSKTDSGGTAVLLNSNLELDAAGIPAASDFMLTVDGVPAEIESVMVHSVRANWLQLKLKKPVYQHSSIRISYTGTSMKTIYGTAYPAFNQMLVVNESPRVFVLPMRIQAEDFDTNQGWELETCTDTGGGVNLSYSSTGDYVEYSILVPQSGTYQFDYRISSNNSNGGQFRVALVSNGQISELHRTTLASTGGWQSWKTLSAQAQLEAGTALLRFEVLRPEFNLNWIDIRMLTSNVPLVENSAPFHVFVQYQNRQLVVQNLNELTQYVHMELYDISGRIVSKRTFNPVGATTLYWDLDSNLHGIYVVKVIGSGFSQSVKLVL